MPELRNLAIRVEYDGSRFAGFQLQPRVLTVQGRLVEALDSLLEPGHRFLAACRTDTGVHALGQVVCVRTRSSIPVDRFRRALAGRVGPHIRIHEVTEVDPGFHPRFAAILRHYRYLMCPDPSRETPITCSYVTYVPRDVDWEIFDATARKLVGSHDYVAFTTVPSEEKRTCRSIDAVGLHRLEDYYAFDLYARSFLRGMVRNITGWLLSIARGLHPPGILDELLASREKTRSVRPAPPQGLYLMRVYYPGDADLPVTPGP